jgi:hypothetical protein
MKPRLFDYIPKDEVWMLPPDLRAPVGNEDVEVWITRVVAAVKAGKVAIIENLGAEPGHEEGR